MNDPYNINTELDDLFDELADDPDITSGLELDWHFMLCAPEVEPLRILGEELETEFEVQLHEEVEVTDESGDVTAGDPLLSVIRRGNLSKDDVTQLANRLALLAEQRGVKLDGIDCYNAIDEQELFGWMKLDDALWRLRHMADIGVEENSELPFAFLVAASSLDSLRQIEQALDKLGFDDRDTYEDPDENGNYGLCAFVAGRNNEAELLRTANAMTVAAESCGGVLDGIQFYTRDDLHEIFVYEEE